MSFLTGVQRQPGGGPPFLPHPVSVHDDFPAVSLERMHPVFCPDAGGVSLGLLGPQREPDGESRSPSLLFLLPKFPYEQHILEICSK